MTNLFQPARVEQKKLRIAIEGTAGAGKTYTALTIAKIMGWKTAMIDTERGSASIYAKEFQFDVASPPDHDPTKYIKAIRAAEEAGYDCLIIDSLSHVWQGQGGFLEMADKEAARSMSKNSYTAWRNVTPIYNQMLDTILGSSIHIIATLRQKTEYAMNKDDNGKTSISKMGLAPIQRDGMDYEFDIVGMMTADRHELIITKARQVEGVELDGRIFTKPGEEFVKELKKLITTGDAPKPKPKPAPPPELPEIKNPGQPIKVEQHDDPAQDDVPPENWPPPTEEMPEPPPLPAKKPAASRAKKAPSTATPAPTPTPTATPVVTAPAPQSQSADVISAEDAQAMVRDARTYGWNKVNIKLLLSELGMPDSVMKLTSFQADVFKQSYKDKSIVQRLTVEHYGQEDDAAGDS